MRNIKEIKAEMTKFREEYEVRCRALEAEMEAVRTSRGYVKVEKTYEPYYEAGRSMEPTRG